MQLNVGKSGRFAISCGERKSMVNPTTSPGKLQNPHFSHSVCCERSQPLRMVWRSRVLTKSLRPHKVMYPKSQSQNPLHCLVIPFLFLECYAEFMSSCKISNIKDAYHPMICSGHDQCRTSSTIKSFHTNLKIDVLELMCYYSLCEEDPCFLLKKVWFRNLTPSMTI